MPEAVKQSSTAFGFNGATVYDLYRAIETDQSLSAIERKRALERITATGASGSTPLAAVVHGAFGAAVGYLLARYFGMGVVGRAIASAAGFGVGHALSGRQESGWGRV